MFDEEFPIQLGKLLKSGALPGYAAQRLFAPSLSYGRHAGPATHDARQAAVMILLNYHAGRWEIPLTLRPPAMTDHAGQVCFPGGSVDPGETIVYAALRELREEIGVHEEQVDVVGELTPIYLYNSNFIVIPCLGVTTADPTFELNASEVAEITCLPAEVLLDTKCRQITMIERGTLQIPAPYWCWQHYCIWGATAMMLAELAELMRQLAGVSGTAVLPSAQT